MNDRFFVERGDPNPLSSPFTVDHRAPRANGGASGEALSVRRILPYEIGSRTTLYVQLICGAESCG